MFSRAHVPTFSLYAEVLETAAATKFGLRTPDWLFTIPPFDFAHGPEPVEGHCEIRNSWRYGAVVVLTSL